MATHLKQLLPIRYANILGPQNVYIFTIPATAFGRKLKRSADPENRFQGTEYKKHLIKLISIIE